jgi:hypothetical protein
VIRK